MKKKSNNEFVVDSLGMKEFSILVQERKSIPQIYENFLKQIREKNNEISLLNFKIEEYKDNEVTYKVAMLVRDEKDKLAEKRANEQLRKIKWQRNKAYIVTAVAVVVSVLVISK